MLEAWEALVQRNASIAPEIEGRIVSQFGRLPNRADVCVVLGRLKFLMGDPSSAQNYFERAVRLEPVRYGFTRDWLVALAEQGDQACLAQLMSRLTQDYRWSGEPLRRAVRSAVARLDAQHARPLLELSRPYAEVSAGGLGWLAECHQACGLKAESLALLDRAVKHPLATTDDWLRLMIHTAQPDQPDSITNIVQQAREKLPRAQFYAAAATFADTPVAPKHWKPTIDTDADRKLYTQARLSLKLSRYQRTDAIALLEAYTSDNMLSAQDSAWARRNLAMLLAARGGPADRKRAIQLLGTDGQATGETAEEKRSTAAILAGLSRNLEGDDRKTVLNRAIAILSEVAAETKDRRDRYLLVQLHRSAGNRNAARETLAELISADQRNIDYLVVALEEATEPNDIKFAENCARALLILYPNDFRAVQSVARFEARQGRTERAFVLADHYSRTADATPNDLQTRMARSAELLDELSRWPSIRKTSTGKKMVNAAVEKYSNLYLTRPEAIISAVGLLAGDQRGEEAFKKIETLGKQLPARVRVMAGLAVLRSGNASDQQFDTVKSWIDVASREEPDSLAVMLHDAEWHTLKKQYSNAEKVYDTILKQDPRNVVALNNLAWILSTRKESSTHAEELVDRAMREIGLTGELLDTRARIRITAGQFDAAERDLFQAMSMEKTPLRNFHMALIRQNQTPPRKGEALELFRKARNDGLEMKSIHPADHTAFRLFEQELKK
jgi:Tfp pilus assembly protein PilF